MKYLLYFCLLFAAIWIGMVAYDPEIHVYVKIANTIVVSIIMSTFCYKVYRSVNKEKTNKKKFSWDDIEHCKKLKNLYNSYRLAVGITVFDTEREDIILGFHENGQNGDFKAKSLNITFTPRTRFAIHYVTFDWGCPYVVAEIESVLLYFMNEEAMLLAIKAMDYDNVNIFDHYLVVK